MRISDWSSDVCSSDLSKTGFTKSRGDREILTHQIQAKGPFARFRIFHHGNVADPVGRFEQQADACIVFMDVAEARAVIQRSEERRVGKESVSTGRSRWWRFN